MVQSKSEWKSLELKIQMKYSLLHSWNACTYILCKHVGLWASDDMLRLDLQGRRKCRLTVRDRLGSKLIEWLDWQCKLQLMQMPRICVKRLYKRSQSSIGRMNWEIVEQKQFVYNSPTQLLKFEREKNEKIKLKQFKIIRIFLS